MFFKIRESILLKFPKLEIKEATIEWTNGRKNYCVEIIDGLRRVFFSSGHVEIKYYENEICWMNGPLEGVSVESLENSITDWIINLGNSETFAQYKWLNILESRYLIEQSPHLYTKYIWNQYLQKSFSIYMSIFSSFHPIIRLFSEDSILNKLVPFHSMERIFFKPYIGSTFNLWKNERKNYSFFNGTTDWSVYITYGINRKFSYTFEYNGNKIEDINEKKIGEIIKNIKTKEEEDKTKYYVKSGNYLFKDLNDKTLIEGSAKEIVKTFKEKFGDEIEEAFYNIQRSKPS